MSLEAGGRADKYGNEYENRYLLRLLLQLISGQLTSIIVEPLGENKDSVEFISTDKKGLLWHHQCKAGNRSKSVWDMGDLNACHVFSRSKKILQESPNNRYEFVSPLLYGELTSLCQRARTNNDPGDLIEFQLSNPDIKNVFKSCQKYYQLSSEDPRQLKQLNDLLSRSYFETFLDVNDQNRESKTIVSCYFSGDSSAACITLQNFVNSRSLYGKAITAYDVISFMEQSGFAFRSHLFGENIPNRINDLNTLFSASYLPINGTLFRRDASDKVIDHIKNGHSVILHGKAGMGKSGCVQEIIEALKKEGIPFLSIKLDKHTPEGTADSYGESLGLTQSPLYGLYRAADKNRCVFIMDQLDSLRWTSHHSASALDVCKQMIRQADALNQNENARISLLLISRSFDLETDPGLQSLLKPEKNSSLSWIKTEVSELSHKEVENVIGQEYNLYPVRLQKLLQTPSTLYIWTKLEKRDDARLAVTSQDLLQKWWDQILNNCAKSAPDRNTVSGVKDRIVSLMEKRSSFSLPKRLFSDHTLEIEKLISEGLLMQADDMISFVHQSFLDFFVATDMISQIYDGNNIVSVIGDYDSQTPILRYRLLVVLQQLLGTDERMFIEKSQDILASDLVRFYFKYAVFEAAGQYDSPSSALCGFFYDLFSDEKWHNIVFKIVFYGHLRYIKELGKNRSFDWLNDEGLELLGSVYEKDPDYVISKLPCDTVGSRQQALKIYRVFSPDLSFDTPKALEYRLSVLDAYPEMYDKLRAVVRLVENQSFTLLPVLKGFLQHTDHVSKQIYFGEDKEITAYSKKYCREIIASLLPAVCEATASFHPQSDLSRFDDSFRNWVIHQNNHHFARIITDMIITAMKEYYVKEPESCIAFIRSCNCQKSVVCYGIFSAAILAMNTSDSDFAIQWLCEDTQNHLFIFTENQDDYLALTKRIVKRFSPHCSEESYRRLEDLIYHWNDPAEKMIELFKDRIAINHNKEYKDSVYYAYWGYFQKELLPQMDPTRLSEKSRRLLLVLCRNPWIRTPHYNCGISFSRCGTVASPIYDKTGRIQDSTWLKIISKPDEKMSKHFSKVYKSGAFIESTHSAFASSLSHQAKKEPARFAKLAMRFPENCYSEYVTGVLNAIRYPDQSASAADMDCIVALINRYMNSDHLYIIREILNIIDDLSENNWPDNIIDFVCHTALNTSLAEKYNAYPRKTDDSETESPEAMQITAVNCVPGRAVKTMSGLLSSHPELSKRFIPVFDQLRTDPHDAIRFSLMYGVFSCYSVDRNYSLGLFRTLLSQDIRILGFSDVWNLILEDHLDNSEFYVKNMIAAAYSDIKGLKETAAGHLCAYAVFFDNTLIPKVCCDRFDQGQIDKICIQAISSFSKNEYHIASEKILLYYIRHYNDEIHSLSRLFHDNHIDIDRDEDFLIQLLQSSHEPYVIEDFLEYINKQDQDISRYLHVVHRLSERIIADKDKWNMQSTIHTMIISVIKIFDRNEFHPENKRICLDIWDNIYRNCYEYVKNITDILDERN